MIIVIASKQGASQRKTEGLTACVQFILTAHAGTFIRPRIRHGL